MRLPLPLIVTTFLLLAASPAAAAPAASIGMVDCAAGGVIVTLQNDSGGPVRFQLQRGDEVVATHVQPSGPAATRVVPIPEGRPSQVTVRYGGSWTSAMVMRSCEASSPTEARAATTAADAPYEATPLVAATADAATQSRTAPSTGATAQPAEVALPDEPRGAIGWLVALAALLLAVVVALAPRWRRHARQVTSPAARPPG